MEAAPLSESSTGPKKSRFNRDEPPLAVHEESAREEDTETEAAE